jgi:hypothetical protein
VVRPRLWIEINRVKKRRLIMKQCGWVVAALLLSASAIDASDQGKYFGPELLANTV